MATSKRTTRTSTTDPNRMLAQRFVDHITQQGAKVSGPWLVMETDDGAVRATQLPIIEDAKIASKIGPFGWTKLSQAGTAYISGDDVRNVPTNGDKVVAPVRAVVVGPNGKGGAGHTIGAPEQAIDSSVPDAIRFRFRLAGPNGMETLVQVSPGRVASGRNAGSPRWYVQAIKPNRSSERATTSAGNTRHVAF